MKKTFQSLSALALTFVMLLALAVPAFAAGEDLTITINNPSTGHIYEAYQIFSGDLSGVGTPEDPFVLANIGWGNGITEDGQSALKNKLIDADKGATATAADVAEALAKVSDADEVRAIANIVGENLKNVAGVSSESVGPYTIAGLDAGYYLVKDKDGSQDGDNDGYTRFILEVVGNVTAVPKTGTVPTVTKKVKENVKFGAEYNDVADYNIGDQVPFKLTGTLPENYADYASYQYIFHDTLSKGLTYNGDAEVYVVNGTTKTEVTRSDYNVRYDAGKLTVTFLRLKNISSLDKNSTITVEYTAALNADAVIGQTGNTNAVYLEYSNNPNPGGESNTGETPTDKVIVFTYELDVTKVDGATIGEGKTLVKLPNATFKLYRMNGITKEYAGINDGLISWDTDEGSATALTSDGNGEFKVKGLDDGTYYLKETQAPTGYNTLADPIKIVITADTVHATEWAGTDNAAALTGLTVTADTEAGSADIGYGTVAITIANNKGATLPSTGGVGTTIFYAVGGVLMLGAVVLLITKKRIGGK